MKAIKSFFIAVMCILLSSNIYAQKDRELIIHLKDKTTKTFAVSSIDSISFSSKEQAAPFKINFEEPGELYAEFTVIPDDPEMTYNVMLVEKEEFDKYQSDEEVLADDKLFFQQLADGYGTSISDILGGFIMTGEYNDFHVGLIPGTEYMMWVYGIDMDANATTPLLKKSFKTKSVKPINNKINIDARLEGTSIKSTFTPDDNNLYYTAGLFIDDDVEDPSKIDIKLQRAISNIVTDYILGGEPAGNYLEKASKGETKDIFEGADPNHTYYIVAAYLDNECGICSEVTVKTVGKTPSKEVSSKRIMRSMRLKTNAENIRYRQAVK